MITLETRGYFFFGGGQEMQRGEKITSGQLNLQRHFHVIYEMRYLTKLVFEDHMTCILTVYDLEHMKCWGDGLRYSKNKFCKHW